MSTGPSNSVSANGHVSIRLDTLQTLLRLTRKSVSMIVATNSRPTEKQKQDERNIREFLDSIERGAKIGEVW